MLDGQRQESKDGSIAVQAGGDVVVHHHGLGVAEVRHLVEVFVQQQLPAMQEVARQAAEANAARFCQEFVKQAADSAQVSEAEFARPDSQATFQAALSGVAIKGDDADVELVVAALVRRLEAAHEPLIKQVLEAAIAVLPKLTRPQIAFLALVHYIKSVRHVSANELTHLDLMAAQILPVVEAGLSLSKPNQQYLAGLGLLTLNPVADAPVWLHDLSRTHPFVPADPGQLRASGCGHLVRLYNAYETLGIPEVFLSLSGCAIALLQLRRALGNIDMAIWIR